MRAFRCFLAALLAAGIVSMVTAQPGGFGGFGGFRGGDVDSLVLTNTALQEEIKLTDAQKEKFKPIIDKQTDLNKKSREVFSGGNFDKDKFAEINKERQTLAAESKKLRDEVLTAEQKKRLDQIQVQVMSFSVFHDPEAKRGGAGKGGKGGKGGFGGFGRVSDDQKAVMKRVQETLKLSDSQKSSIKGIESDFNKERSEIMSEAGFGFGRGKGGKGGKAGKGTKGGFDLEKLEAANKKVERVRKEAWGKVEEVFDDGQKKSWKTIVGTPFDTSKLTTPRRTQPKKD